MSVEYCPTEDIIGDYFTKSLQGSQFRNAILGIDEIDITRYNSEASAMLKKKKEELSFIYTPPLGYYIVLYLKRQKRFCNRSPVYSIVCTE